MYPYPDTVAINVINTGTFVHTQDVTSWAEYLNLATGVFRAHMRTSAADPVVQYEWSTDNGRIVYMESPAEGSIAFTTNPIAGTFLVIGSSSIQFVASGASGLQVNIGGNVGTTLASLLTLLQTSSDSQIQLCTYVLSGLTIELQAKTSGITGNSIALSTTVAGATASGSTLTGGAHTIALIAPLSETEGFSGNYVFDCRFESNEALYQPIFGGTMTWDQGVTRNANDASVSAETIPSAAYAVSRASFLNVLLFG